MAAAAELEAADVVASLNALATDGLVSHEAGVFGGWAITDAGRRSDAEWVAGGLEGVRGRVGVTDLYESFLTLNPKLLQVCHDWQIQTAGRAHIPNDHRDARYDSRVIDRLVTIDGSAQTILASLSGRLPRFGSYGRRLAAALERVEGGQHAYFADHLESYHTVWFQLHEDLLVTLGLERGA